MNWRNLADLMRLVTAEFGRCRAASPDVVVGIPRSGMLPASAIALLLDRPLADIDSFCRGLQMRRNHAESSSKARRILLVDDSTNSGKAMAAAVATIQSARPTVAITRVAVFAKPERPGNVDLFFDLCPGPRVFQWNLWRNEKIERFAFDIDGVLCRDPTGHENDDGPRYERFLETVDPWHVPMRPVGWLVTCRLEKYRRLTEAWLERHGIRYGELVMLDLPSKAARLDAQPAVRFKAEVYERTGARLFVESSHKKARGIAKVAGRPVLSIEGMALVGPMEAAADAA